MNTTSDNRAVTNQDHVFPHRVIRCGIFPGRVLEAIAAWHLRRRQRAQLHALDDRTLNDIGVSRWEIDSIVNSPHRDGPKRTGHS